MLSSWNKQQQQQDKLISSTGSVTISAAGSGSSPKNNNNNNNNNNQYGSNTPIAGSVATATSGGIEALGVSSQVPIASINGIGTSSINGATIGQVQSQQQQQQTGTQQVQQQQQQSLTGVVRKRGSMSPNSRRTRGSTLSSIPAYQFSAEQRAQIVNFRIKRDLWIRELQEVFNKIYENFIGVLEQIKAKQMHHRESSRAEKVQLRKKLRAQMKEIGKIAASLSGDSKDSFIQLQENLPIAHYYKQNIMEMHKLLSILLKLSLDTIHLDKIKTQKRQNNKCSAPLTEEIKQSYLRVQRLKAGNKLGKVIQDQVGYYQRTHNITQSSSGAAIPTVASTHSQHAQMSVQKSNKPIVTIDKQQQQSIQEENDEDEDYDEFALNHTEEEERQIANKLQFSGDGKFDVNIALKMFKEKKEDVENMIEKFAENVNDASNFNFDEKYKNFATYFTKRYDLIGLYFGDEKLNRFMEENAQRAKEPRAATTAAVDEFEDLYKDLDPSNFQVDNKNIEALQRIVKINEEIRKSLIEEEHLAKMNAIQNINVEQTQQLWTSVFENNINSNAHHHSNNSNNQIDFSKSSSFRSKNSDNNANTNQNNRGLGIGAEQKQSKQSKKYHKDGRGSPDENDHQSSGFFPKTQFGGGTSAQQAAIAATTGGDFFMKSKQQQGKASRAEELAELKTYHAYIHRNINPELHPSNPSLKPISSAIKGRFGMDNIKFLPITDTQQQQGNRIVSSNFCLDKEAEIRKKRTMIDSAGFAATMSSNGFDGGSTTKGPAPGTGDSFRRTFMQRSGYLSTPMSSMGATTTQNVMASAAMNSPTFEGVVAAVEGTGTQSGFFGSNKIMFPQSTKAKKRASQNYMFPKPRETLSFEDEMKLLSQQTKGETPLYLNKFNAHNYTYALPPSSHSSKHIGTAAGQAGLFSIQNTSNNSYISTSVGVSRSAQHTMKAASNTTASFFKAERRTEKEQKSVEIQNAAAISNGSLLGSAVKNPELNIAKPPGISQNVNIQNEAPLISGNNNQTFGQAAAIAGTATAAAQILKEKANSVYLKNEISPVFRHSQKDMLFKINGHNWRQSNKV